jgi:hypothetical protein
MLFVGWCLEDLAAKYYLVHEFLKEDIFVRAQIDSLGHILLQTGPADWSLWCSVPKQINTAFKIES